MNIEEIVKQIDGAISKLQQARVHRYGARERSCPAHDDSIGLQLAKVLRQHLLGRPRNEPRKLAAHGARSQRTKDLHSPLALEEHDDCDRRIAYVTEPKSRFHGYSFVQPVPA